MKKFTVVTLLTFFILVLAFSISALAVTTSIEKNQVMNFTDESPPVFSMQDFGAYPDALKESNLATFDLISDWGALSDWRPKGINSTTPAAQQTYMLSLMNGGGKPINPFVIYNVIGTQTFAMLTGDQPQPTIALHGVLTAKTIWQANIGYIADLSNDLVIGDNSGTYSNPFYTNPVVLHEDSGF